MRYVVAPWRAPYVRSVQKSAACIFCRAVRVKNDRDAYVLYRGRTSFIILNKFPYQPGHVMIAPKRHLAVFERCPKSISDEIADLTKLSLRVLRKGYHPRGFNTGMNLGRSAGAGVVSHFHVHVVPRWPGDSNFMPLFGVTKVVIEDLDMTYDRLLPLFHREARKR
jgi:ATP adenylyltransferase